MLVDSVGKFKDNHSGEIVFTNFTNVVDVQVLNGLAKMLVR